MKSNKVLLNNSNRTWNDLILWNNYMMSITEELQKNWRHHVPFQKKSHFSTCLNMKIVFHFHLLGSYNYKYATLHQMYQKTWICRSHTMPYTWKVTWAENWFFCNILVLSQTYVLYTHINNPTFISAEKCHFKNIEVLHVNQL